MRVNYIAVFNTSYGMGRNRSRSGRKKHQIAGSSTTLQLSTKVQLSNSLHILLTKFKDLFAEPNSLPPQRPLDHSICLKPNSTPVNIRACRYSPIQKVEIEKKSPTCYPPLSFNLAKASLPLLFSLWEKKKKMESEGFVLTTVNSTPTP